MHWGCRGMTKSQTRGELRNFEEKEIIKSFEEDAESYDGESEQINYSNCGELLRHEHKLLISKRRRQPL